MFTNIYEWTRDIVFWKRLGSEYCRIKYQNNYDLYYFTVGTYWHNKCGRNFYEPVPIIE